MPMLPLVRVFSVEKGAFPRFSCRCVFSLFLGALLLFLAGRGSLAQGKEHPYTCRCLPAAKLPPDVKPPILDGDLSDPAWKLAAKAEIFLDPQTARPTQDQTEAYLLYDSRYIYVAFHCHESQPNAIVARETVRDSNLGDDDTVRVEIDPFHTCKFEDCASFTVNPLGTRNAHLGGGRAGKLEWQGDWDAATRRTPDGWTAEMRIPWAILSYPQHRGRMTMGINFYRAQQRTRITSFWSDLGPQQFYEREGIWQGVEAPAQTWKPRFSVLPYLEPIGEGAGSANRVHSGLDARYQPTPEMTAVATINPDFASVEGAVEGIAFTRSERYVPERRPFFLEGGDYLRMGQGYAIGQYFNSTHIPQFDTGIKLYGKIDPKNTIGMLGTLAVGQQANYVAQLRHEFSTTSSANLMVLQRLEAGNDNTVAALGQSFRKGKWSVDGQFAQSAGVDAGGSAWTGAINLEDRNLFTTIRYLHVGEKFVDRLGTISFNDFQGWSSYTHWGAEWRHGPLRGFNVDVFPTLDWHTDGRPFRRQLGLGFGFDTRNDYTMGFHVEGGKFDADTDFTYGLDFGGGVSNRFRQWRFSVTTGQQANLPYTAFGPSFSVRLAKKLDLSVSSFLQSYQGLSQQHILTFSYELSPYRSWGGRVVVQDADTNFYISYRNSGRGGMDTYLILGDPNAKRFTKRIMMKWVFAI
jgi:hypothetical protein